MFSQASHNSRTSVRRAAIEGTGTAAQVTELIADLQADAAELLTGLHRIQHDFGYIPEEAITLLAAQFRTSPAIVFGTIAFYSELRTQPPAENVVEWCSGPACLLKGSSRIQRALEAELGCAMSKATSDGRFELRLVQCDGTCELAPQLRFRGKYMGPMTSSSSIHFARSLKGDIPEAARPAPGREDQAAVDDSTGETDE